MLTEAVTVALRRGIACCVSRIPLKLALKFATEKTNDCLCCARVIGTCDQISGVEGVMQRKRHLPQSGDE
jgi:hypothetical protein